MFPPCGSRQLGVARIDADASISLYRVDPPTLTLSSPFLTGNLGKGFYLFKLPASAPYPLRVVTTVPAGPGQGAFGDSWYTGPFNASVCPSLYATACKGDGSCSFYVTCPDEYVKVSSFGLGS